MRVLSHHSVIVEQVIELEAHDGDGRRRIYRNTGGVRLCLCDEADDVTRVLKWCEGAGRLVGKSVAWLGGGFCTGPRAFAIAGCQQTVFELEASLEEFCPAGCLFVAGDWHTTLAGVYDVIIHDAAGDFDPSEVAEHLNSGGVVLHHGGGPSA
jgi:hypothetical protein